MRIELIKCLKNKPLVVVGILWFILMVFLAPGSGSSFSTSSCFFEGQQHEAHPLIYSFSSRNAYISCIFLPMLSYLIYIIDTGLYRSQRINFLRQSISKGLISKIMVLTAISWFIYVINTLTYALLFWLRFDILITDAPYLLTFISLKFALNSFLFISFLLLAITLLKSGRQLIYFIGAGLFLVFSVLFSSSYYTPFNWFVNSLGFMNRLRENNLYSPLADFRSEFFMLLLILFLASVFYLKYEKKQTAY